MPHSSGVNTFYILNLSLICPVFYPSSVFILSCSLSRISLVFCPVTCPVFYTVAVFILSQICPVFCLVIYPVLSSVFCADKLSHFSQFASTCLTFVLHRSGFRWVNMQTSLALALLSSLPSLICPPNFYSIHSPPVQSTEELQEVCAGNMRLINPVINVEVFTK